jgi:O-antigen/teichoic acid export membrane protein/acetyltransferase-like isoleucine patch superfamily enzyme
MKRKLFSGQPHAQFDQIASLADDVTVDEEADGSNESGEKENLTIGAQSRIIGSIDVRAGGSVQIGERFYLGLGARVCIARSAIIGNNVIISDHARVFDREEHPENPRGGGDFREHGPLVICDRAWIGEGAYIPKGITIGEGAVVAPHSAVISDVPSYAMVSGNPAKLTKMLKKPMQRGHDIHAGSSPDVVERYDGLAEPSFHNAYFQALFVGGRLTVDGTDIANLMQKRSASGREELIDEADRRYESVASKKGGAIGGTTTDSLSLAVVRILTMLVGLATTMLLSRAFSLEMYGTYAQGVTIMTMALSFTTWGMLDAINYFVNSRPFEERKSYIDTVFSIIFAAGGVTGALILLFQRQIFAYFDNPGLSEIIGLIAFRPLLEILINALQVLYISVGKAKLMAVRNIIASIFRLLFAFVATKITNSLATIFIGQLLLDIVVLEYLWVSLFNEGIVIVPLRLKAHKIVEIFRFGIPMAMHSLIKVLLRDMDKLFIGRYEPTERYALYANASYSIPYDLISNAFLLVIFPILTRHFAEEKYGPARRMLSGYIKISYLTNFTFSVAILLVARECVELLFGEKYLPGASVFALYVWVDVIRTLNLSTVLSAKGWAKKLMYISLGAVLLNFGLNYVAYWALGFIGPALATVTCTLIITAITCALSGRALHTPFIKLLNVREFGWFLMQAAALGGVSLLLRGWLRSVGAPYLLVFAAVGGTFVFGMLLLNRKRMFALFREMNTFKL